MRLKSEIASSLSSETWRVTGGYDLAMRCGCEMSPTDQRRRDDVEMREGNRDWNDREMTLLLDASETASVSQAEKFGRIT